MNTGSCGDLFGYSSDIEPTAIDPVQVRFEGTNGETIGLYDSTGAKLIAKYNHAFPSAHLEEICSHVGLSPSNIEWAERQILQQVLAKICGAEYVPNEGGVLFIERITPYEQRWRRQQC